MNGTNGNGNGNGHPANGNGLAHVPGDYATTLANEGIGNLIDNAGRVCRNERERIEAANRPAIAAAKAELETVERARLFRPNQGNIRDLHLRRRAHPPRQNQTSVISVASI